jgi:hypothetical protein
MFARCGAWKSVARPCVLAASILAACSSEGTSGVSQRGAPLDKPSAGEVVSLVSATADPRARDALLAAAHATTASPSAQLVLTEAARSAFTHPVELAPPPPPSAAPAMNVSSFRHIVRASESIEVALRQTIYFDLVTRCKDAAGRVLPPEAIALVFQLDDRGVLVPSSIRTRIVIDGPGHASAAECMARALAGSGFRVPTSTEGDVSDVETLVPSVD